MLKAILKSGQALLLTDEISREQLLKLRENYEFYCPSCKQKVVLKIGKVVIPHFAHYRNIDCHTFSDGETATHINGKKALYNWFRQQRILVNVEPYLKGVKQRPDLLIKRAEHYYAIEFQCSSMTSKDFIRRKKGYEKLQLAVWWLPKNQKYFKVGLQRIQLRPIDEFAIQMNRLITFDVERKVFHVYRGFLHISGRQYLTYGVKRALKDTTFPLTLPPIKVTSAQLEKIWLAERNRYLANRVKFNRRGLRDPFLKFCYEHKISLFELPNWIGVPSILKLKVHSVEWQLIAVTLLKNNTLSDMYRIFQQQFPQYRVPENILLAYIEVVSKENPQFRWQHLKNIPISEELTANMLH